MPFQIDALPPDQFAPFFRMSESELARHDARKMIVTTCPGTPCRVSLEDARVGETVLLVNYEHQPAKSPYRSCHAIFVREGVRQAVPPKNAVPPVLRARLVSIRLFDLDDIMVDADVVAGAHLAQAIEHAFADATVSYLHLHYAKPGCYAARALRA